MMKIFKEMQCLEHYFPSETKFVCNQVILFDGSSSAAPFFFFFFNALQTPLFGLHMNALVVLH